MKKIIVALLLCTVLAATSVACQTKPKVTGEANIVGAYPEMNNPEFWIAQQKEPDKLIMTPEKIAEFNVKIPQNEEASCVELSSYPDTLSSDELLKNIRHYEVATEPRYRGSELITAEQNAVMLENRNEEAVAAENPIKWGVIVENSELRTFPTSEVIYDLVDDFEFDLCCETVLKTCERVAILHQSKDNNWLLVQAYSYLGWVEQKNIAVTDKATWVALGEQTDWLVVTGNRVVLDHNNVTPATSHRELTMGTRLPRVTEKPANIDGISTLSSHVAKIPLRTANGSLLMSDVRIPMNLDVTEGFIPYTTRNILTQSFKMLGERYGWSSLWEARDCSAFLQDIFQCFGIDLPRNASTMMSVAGAKTDITALSPEQRRAEVLKQPVGTFIKMPGHIAMYLGEYNGVPYMFHQTYTISAVKDAEPMRIATALVTSMEIYKNPTDTYLDYITTLNTIKKP